jgi:hypothetical protein
MTATRRVTRWLAPALVLAVLVAGGCGPAHYPVTGRVVYEDGTPLPEGSVVGETTVDGKKVMAQGDVRPDGTFTWGTGKPGDGARPGTYRVIVVPRALGDAELAKGELPAVDPKFSNPDTSGIEFEVKEGKNELYITVKRAQPKPEPEPKPDPEAKKDPDPNAKPDPKPEIAPAPQPKPDPAAKKESPK